MNLLIDRLSSNPDILVAAVTRYIQTGSEPDPYWIFNEMAGIRSIAQEGTLARDAVKFVSDSATEYAVAKAFLGVVEENALTEALDVAAQRSPIQSPEWVTFLTAPGTGHGLTLPDDDSLDRKLSFFCEAEGYRTVDVVPSDQAAAERYDIRANTDHGHCELPSRQRCSSPGSCGASCVPYPVSERGYVCLCEHSR